MQLNNLGRTDKSIELDDWSVPLEAQPDPRWSTTVPYPAGDGKNPRGRYSIHFHRTLDVNANKAIVEGVNLVKKHEKPSAANPQGGISEKEAPIHISNLSLKDPNSGEATRVGYRMEGDKKVRFSKKSNQVL